MAVARQHLPGTTRSVHIYHNTDLWCVSQDTQCERSLHAGQAGDAGGLLGTPAGTSLRSRGLKADQARAQLREKKRAQRNKGGRRQLLRTACTDADASSVCIWRSEWDSATANLAERLTRARQPSQALAVHTPPCCRNKLSLTHTHTRKRVWSVARTHLSPGGRFHRSVQRRPRRAPTPAPALAPL